MTMSKYDIYIVDDTENPRNYVWMSEYRSINTRGALLDEIDYWEDDITHNHSGGWTKGHEYSIYVMDNTEEIPQYDYRCYAYCEEVGLDGIDPDKEETTYEADL